MNTDARNYISVQSRCLCVLSLYKFIVLFNQHMKLHLHLRTESRWVYILGNWSTTGLYFLMSIRLCNCFIKTTLVRFNKLMLLRLLLLEGGKFSCIVCAGRTKQNVSCSWAKPSKGWRSHQDCPYSRWECGRDAYLCAISKDEGRVRIRTAGQTGEEMPISVLCQSL